MEFQSLTTSSPVEVKGHLEEARFSFLQGGYVEDFDSEGNIISLFWKQLREQC